MTFEMFSTIFSLTFHRCWWHSFSFNSYFTIAFNALPIPWLIYSSPYLKLSSSQIGRSSLSFEHLLALQVYYLHLLILITSYVCICYLGVKPNYFLTLNVLYQVPFDDFAAHSIILVAIIFYHKKIWI